MMRIFRPFVSTLLVIFGLAASSWAQSTPRLSRLEVAIWPEYDQPSALVILRAQLPPDAVLPTTIPLAMPAIVPAPNAVAERDPGGGLVLAQYTTEPRGNWTTFNIIANSNEVRLEYYTPMDLSQPQREFLYEWPGGIEIDQVVYEVQQPAGATDLVVVPPPAQRNPGADGLIYAFADLGPAAANEARTIALTYTKATPGLSMAATQPAFPQPVQQAPPAQSSAPATSQPATGGSSPWLITLAIVLGVGILVVWFVVSGKRD